MSVKMLPLPNGELIPVPVCEVCGEVADAPEPVSTRTINMVQDGVWQSIQFRFYTCPQHWREVKRIARSFSAKKAQGYQRVQS